MSKHYPGKEKNDPPLIAWQAEIGETMNMWNRRIAGMLSARLPELKLGDVADPRDPRGRRWQLRTLLSAMLLGMMAGCKSLKETEALTDELSLGVRRRLRIRRRTPDTTLRDAAIVVDPTELRERLCTEIKAAHRRKALVPEDLPFGVVAMDGKATIVQEYDDCYAQKREYGDGRIPDAIVRTMTCSLVSARGRPCIDAIPIPAETNEMGHFEVALKQLCKAYRGTNLFRLVSYDAGACSEKNAQVTIDLGLDYLMALKENQPTVLWNAKQLNRRGRERCLAHSVTVVNNNEIVTRRLWKHTNYTNSGLPGLKTYLRVESEATDAKGEVLTRIDRKTGEVLPRRENRYFACSLAWDELTADHWLLLVRRHWSVENDCHKTWDVSFEEDDRPWIVGSAKGMVVIQLLRRLAYNLLTLWRSVTLRSEANQKLPWADILRRVYNTLTGATAEELKGLRRRKVPAIS